MKKLIVILMLLGLVSYAVADEACTTQTGQEESTDKQEITTDVPAWLKGATITVTLANGKSSTVSANLFKVVPRKQQFVVTHTERTNVVSCINNSNYKNRVSVLGGRGTKDGLDRNNTNTPNEVDVSSRNGFVAGLQYQRLLPILSDRFSIGVQVQTNKTASGLLGLDF